MTNNNSNKLPQLQFRRFEFKYRLPIFLVKHIMSDLFDYMEWDPFVKDNPDKSYCVSSLYLDSAGLGCYHEKLAGIKKRKKLRFRFYADVFEPDTKIFVEIKRKNDMTVLKDRLVIDYQNCVNFLSGKESISDSKMSVQEKDVLREFLWTKKHNCLTPKIMVVYKRQPLIGRLDCRFRITFDSCLQAYPADRLCFSERRKDILSKDVIMELKYNNTIPGWFHCIVQKYQLNREPFSKYCKSLEGCYVY